YAPGQSPAPSGWPNSAQGPQPPGPLDPSTGVLYDAHAPEAHIREAGMRQDRVGIPRLFYVLLLVGIIALPLAGASCGGGGGSKSTTTTTTSATGGGGGSGSGGGASSGGGSSGTNKATTTTKAPTTTRRRIPLPSVSVLPPRQ